MDATVETRYEHIVLDNEGVAKITGSRIKVAHLAAEHVHWGWVQKRSHISTPL
jgi:hypothetical protein